MDDLHRWKVNGWPAGFFRAITPIQFLRVHKKAFIESTYLLVHPAPHKHGGASDPVHLLRCVVGCVKHIITRDDVAVGKPLLQSGRFEKRGRECGESPTRGLE